MCLRKWIQKLFAPKPLAEAVTEIIQSEEELTAPTLTEMKFYIVVPQAATNLVTNPTPYRATTGYTAFDPDSAGTIAIAGSDTYTRRGPKCIKITTLASHDAGVYFSSVTGADGTTYTFSADVLTTAGEAMVLAICSDVAGTVLAKTDFTSTGYWQRQEVSLLGTSGNAGTWYLHLYRDGASSHAYDIYTDGWQFEAASAATTFFSGDTQGFGIAPLEFYWGGTPHASVSYRTADTRAGGTLLDLETYAVVSAGFGLGMGNFNQIYNELASGGAYYQKHIRKPRNFSLLLSYYGDNAGDLHDKRNAVIEAVRPDYTGYDQPLIIRYQGENASGYEATNPVDIVCIPQPSHTDLPDNSRLQTNEVLNFTVLDSYLQGAYIEGKELDPSVSNVSANRIVSRDSDGLWSALGTGMNGSVWAIAFAPNGDLYAGGNFTTAGGVTVNYIAKWNGASWSALGTGMNGIVYVLAFAPNGDLYAGGSFTTAGGVTVNYIAKWDGSSWSALGTGMNDIVRAIAFAPNGDLYAGGYFTTAGGVSANRIAKWNGSSWSALGTGMNGSVRAIAFAPNGDLYAGGVFTTAGGIALLDRIAIWRGGAWGYVDADLPAGTDYVYAIVIDSKHLFIGGDFAGTGSFSSQSTVNNSANANVYPIMEINGPGVLQGFSNYTTGKSIQFDGLTLQAGETITITLDPIDLKMTSNWRGNCLRYVAAGSDLSDFYLRPGDNYISFFMPSGTTAATKAYISWIPKFWNIEGSRYE